MDKKFVVVNTMINQHGEPYVVPTQQGMIFDTAEEAKTEAAKMNGAMKPKWQSYKRGEVA